MAIVRKLNEAKTAANDELTDAYIVMFAEDIEQAENIYRAVGSHLGRNCSIKIVVPTLFHVEPEELQTSIGYFYELRDRFNLEADFLFEAADSAIWIGHELY